MADEQPAVVCCKNAASLRHGAGVILTLFGQRNLASLCRFSLVLFTLDSSSSDCETYVLGFVRQFAVWVTLCALAGGCSSVEKRIAPSNFRDWRPEQSVLPHAEFQGDQVTVHNVR